MNRRFLIAYGVSLLFSAWLWLYRGRKAFGQTQGGLPQSPSALARVSFNALKEGDFPKFVSLIHPDELKRFKEFTTQVVNWDSNDEVAKQIRQLLAPLNSSKSVADATGSDLLIRFTTNSVASIPGYTELMAGAELTILGEIAENAETIHVIARTVLPRPQPVSFQKHEGRWYQLLNQETMQLISAFEKTKHFREKNLSLNEAIAKTKISDVEVIGHVKDGQDLAQVLCRVQMKIEDFAFPILACYPVREGEAAWDHLDDKDKSEFVKALKAKWNVVDATRSGR